LVADRLRELESRGVVGRRKLAPPAGSWVYELTEWGRELEPIMLALGSWGVRVPLPPAPATLSATSVLLFLRTSAHPDPKAPSTIYRFELDDHVWTIRTASGQVYVEPGEPARADASLRADPETLNALLDDPAALDAAVSAGSVAVAGDLPALRGLLQAVAIPSPAAG
jgi:hypothetical protein